MPGNSLSQRQEYERLDLTAILPDSRDKSSFAYNDFCHPFLFLSRVPVVAGSFADYKIAFIVRVILPGRIKRVVVYFRKGISAQLHNQEKLPLDSLHSNQVSSKRGLCVRRI